jgi:hypothetical protein
VLLSLALCPSVHERASTRWLATVGVGFACSLCWWYECVFCFESVFATDSSFSPRLSLFLHLPAALQCLDRDIRNQRHRAAVPQQREQPINSGHCHRRHRPVRVAFSCVVKRCGERGLCEYGGDDVVVRVKVIALVMALHS